MNFDRRISLENLSRDVKKLRIYLYSQRKKGIISFIFNIISMTENQNNFLVHVQFRKKYTLSLDENNLRRAHPRLFHLTARSYIRVLIMLAM